MVLGKTPINPTINILQQDVLTIQIRIIDKP